MDDTNNNNNPPDGLDFDEITIEESPLDGAACPPIPPCQTEVPLPFGVPKSEAAKTQDLIGLLGTYKFPVVETTTDVVKICEDRCNAIKKEKAASCAEVRKRVALMLKNNGCPSIVKAYTKPSKKKSTKKKSSTKRKTARKSYPCY